MKTSWKEDWKKDLAKTVAWIFVGSLLVIGSMLLLANGKDFLTAVKPAYDVGDLADNGGAREGMHVTGRLPYIYDCFANMSDMKGGHVSEYYYALPTGDGILIVGVSSREQEAMEALREETWQYLEQGILPISTVPVEGYIAKAQGRLPYLLAEYMAEAGYAQEDIDAMREPLLLQSAAEKLDRARIYAPVGVIMLASGILLCVLFGFLKMRKK